MFDLTGKKAIVTGASRGLGKGMASGLLKSGAEVVLIDVSPDVEKTKAEFESKREANVYALKGDLTNQAERRRLFYEAVNLLGGELDILVNTAGISKNSPSTDFSMEDWKQVFDINVSAVFELCKFAGEIMVEQKRGKIINIASIVSFIGGVNNAAYAASKGALTQLTKSLSNEWAIHGVQVNAIAPGCMVTPMTSHLFKDESRRSELTLRIPAGRWGTPEDLEGITIFLASEASNYITGTVIPVDGGFLAR